MTNKFSRKDYIFANVWQRDNSCYRLRLLKKKKKFSLHPQIENLITLLSKSDSHHTMTSMHNLSTYWARLPTLVATTCRSRFSSARQHPLQAPTGRMGRRPSITLANEIHRVAKRTLSIPLIWSEGKNWHSVTGSIYRPVFPFSRAPKPSTGHSFVIFFQSFSFSSSTVYFSYRESLQLILLH